MIRTFIVLSSLLICSLSAYVSALAADEGERKATIKTPETDPELPAIQKVRAAAEKAERKPLEKTPDRMKSQSEPQEVCAEGYKMVCPTDAKSCRCVKDGDDKPGNFQIQR